MRRIAILLLAALGSAGAGDAVVAGPWVLVGDGDVVEVGVACAAPAGRPLPRVELQRDGRPLEATVTDRALTRARLPPAVVMSLRLPALPAVAGPCTLLVDGVAHGVVLPSRPSPSTAVRIAVAGARNWPGSADLERLAGILGGPVSVVVAVGAGVADQLGRGGWESSIPVLPLLPRHPAASRPPTEREAVDGALWGPALTWWPGGATWGVLGLPAGGDEDQARSAMARDLSPWLVHVAHNVPWDPALTAGHGRGSPADLLPLVGFCQRFGVPVVLVADGHAGWISEPFAVDQGRVVRQAGGTRFIGATPAGEPLASLPDDLALAIEHPGLVGLAATTTELTVGIIGLGSAAAVQHLRYGVTGPERRRHGSGWGMAEVESCQAAWNAGGTQAAAALEELSWVALPGFLRLRLGNDEFARLLTAAANDAAALRLMRRLLAVDQMLTSHIAPALAQAPAIVARDLVLRQLARSRPLDTEVWSGPVVHGGDEALVRAVQAAAGAGDRIMLDLLVVRLRNQAAGAVPLESDPILQHRILCTVFDADTLSPTPLRELALALRSRVDALGKGPVERFLARVGEKRPVAP